MRFKSSAVKFAIIDMVAALTALGAVYLLFGSRFFPPGNWDYFLLALIVVISTVAGFLIAGVYRILWRYAQLAGFYIIFWGVLLGQTLGYLFARVAFDIPMPIRVWVTQSLILFLLTMVSRGFVRIFHEGFFTRRNDDLDHGKKVIIVGAGSAGVMVVREICRTMRSQYHAVGFVDDNPYKQGYTVHGVPILGYLSDLPKLADKYSIDEIIIAIPSAEQEVIRKIAALIFTRPVKLQIMPGIDALINGTVDIRRFREVQVEDLLGRSPACVDLNEIAAYLTGKNILITGAGGSIGSELCRQVAQFNPHSLILLGKGENSIYEIGTEMKESYPNLKFHQVIADVRDSQAIGRIFKMFRPQVVFHAAAHKHVPLMEDWPEEAFKNNVFGTRNVAMAAHEHNCEHFVLISTDKAIKPSSVMGATKRIAEMIIRVLSERSKTKFVAVRFGNVLGSRGSVVPLFKHQIERGGPITITHPDMKRYFMTIPEAAQLVIQAGAIGEGGEVFVLDMGEPVRIVELAEKLIQLSGLVPGKDIPIVFTGVRNGEKLFEELLSEEEGITATRHERIFRTNLPNGVRTDLFSFLERIEQSFAAGKAYSVELILSELVSDYRNLDGVIDEVAVTNADSMK